MVNQENTAGFSIYFDQIAVSPTRLARGAIVTEWEIYTPTGSLTTNTTYTGKYRRVGDTAEIEVLVSFGGTNTEGAVTVNLPSDLTIDTSKISATGGDQSFGIAKLNDATVGSFLGRVEYETTTSVQLRHFNDSGSFEVLGSTNTSTSTPFTIASGDSFLLKFSVPIQGWASSGTLNEDLGGGDVVVEGAGNGGTVITADVTDIDFTETRDTSSSWNGNQFTAPSTGNYSVSGHLFFTTGSTLRSPELYVNGSPVKRIGSNTSDNHPFEGNIFLNKGDVLSLRSGNNGGTLSNNTVLHWITITKLASGSQKFETATVAARYTSNSGQTLSGSTKLIYEDLDKDSHNSYSATGVYTVPVSGWYSISASIRYASTAWSTGDNVEIYYKVNSSDVGGSLVRVQTGNTSSIVVQFSDKKYLNNGDELEIWGVNAQNASTDTNAFYNYFSIARIK